MKTRSFSSTTSAIRLAIHDIRLTDSTFTMPRPLRAAQRLRADGRTRSFSTAHARDVAGDRARIKATHPGVPIIILTSHASIDLAVTAIKGRRSVMTKPVQPMRCRSYCGGCSETGRGEAHLRRHRRESRRRRRPVRRHERGDAASASRCRRVATAERPVSSGGPDPDECSPVAASLRPAVRGRWSS
jgi:hypothetical protein